MVVAVAELSGSLAMAADANHGSDLAKRWCATCHVVNSEQKQASTDAPPFAVIARKSDFTPEKIAFFLLDPHPRMPSFRAASTAYLPHRNTSGPRRLAISINPARTAGCNG